VADETDTATEGGHGDEGDHRDELPPDLDVTGFVGPYQFPDVARRRIQGAIYLVIAVALIALWVAKRDGGVLVDGGFFVLGHALAVVGLYHVGAGWPLKVKETDALVSAAAEVGFPVGHASAQLGFRGLLSRPTWRILLYSAEDPPAQRGLVLVDGVDASVVAHFVEANPEDWSGD
jgi:hypothetical protein